MRVTLTEASTFVEAATPAPGPGRLLIRLIDAGKGSSGIYTPEVLKAAAESKVFRAGTHMFIDHPTETEEWDRPERTLRDLAAVLTEDARWDEPTQALVAEARVFEAWRQPLADMAADIGVSIRAYAETGPGTWEGKATTVITALTEAVSVDFVTAAGRGGKVLQVIESARATPRSREAKASDRREQLRALIADAYGGDRIWTYLRDFDDAATTAWFEIETPDAVDLWQQSYDVTDDVATALTGTAMKVRVRTEYVPVGEAAEAAVSRAAESLASATAIPIEEATAVAKEALSSFALTSVAEAAPTNVPVNPAGQSTTQESEEDTMPQIEEARLRQLEEAHGRVPALESELAAAKAQAEESKQRALQAEAATYARDFARNLVTKANGDLAEASVARIVGDATRATLPLLESGRLDTEQFTPIVEKARTEEETYLAQVAEASGIGSVRGVGPIVGEKAADLTEAELDAALANLSGRTVKEA